MKTRMQISSSTTVTGRKAVVSEILILADGQIYAHNITPAMARTLLELNPDDEAMKQRAGNKISRT